MDQDDKKLLLDIRKQNKDAEEDGEVSDPKEEKPWDELSPMEKLMRAEIGGAANEALELQDIEL